MAKLTTKALAEVKFQADTKELEQVSKFLKEKTAKVPLGDSLRSEMKGLEIQFDELLKKYGSIDPKDLTPELALHMTKEKEELFKQAEKVNKKLLKEVTQSTDTQLSLLEERIKTLKQEVTEEGRDLQTEEQRFPEDPDSEGDRMFSSIKSESKFLREQAEDTLKVLEKMKGASGENIGNFRSMYDNAGKIKENLEEIPGLQEKINHATQEGLSLKELVQNLDSEEIEQIEGILAEKHKNFEIESALEQVIIRKNLEKRKSEFLDKKAVDYAEQQNTYLVKKEELEKREKQRLQILEKIKQGATATQQEMLSLYQEFGNISAQALGTGVANTKELEKAMKDATAAKKTLNKETKKSETTFGKAANQVFNYGIAFTFLRRMYRETLRTIKDLDQALTEMAIVTAMNREETWQLIGTMQQLAQETGFTTTEISKLSTVYFRQGRTLREVTELTRVAAQAARVAGISAAESADYLTSAVNAFQLSADQALDVSDKFAALAASSASSYEELAVGLSKFAAQANVAGVSIDFAMGLLSKGIETTREAPETIGTALKTVIARMRELTDLGKTFEDGMDISRVETALRQVGVALRDEQGQFRNLELVLTEIGQKWDTLNTNQQASIAVALAGTRQQSRLIAVMQNFDRTLELVDIAQESAGATMAQHTQFMRGMEAASVGLQTAYQNFITTITESELIIGIVRGLSGVITGLSNGLKAIGFSGQLAMVSLMGVFAAMKLKKSLGIIIEKWQARQIVLETTQNKIRLINIKIEKAQSLLRSKRISDEKRIRTQQILDNALTEKKNITTVKSLFLQKLQILGNKVELQTRISNIQGLIAEKISKMGLIIVNGTLLASTWALIKGMIVFFGVMLTNPIGWIVVVVGLLVKGFIDLRNGTESTSAAFASSFQGIVRVVKTLFDAVMQLGKILFDLMKIFALPYVMFFRGVMWQLQQALKIVTIAFNFLAGGIQIVVNWLKNASEGIKDFISNIPILEKAFSTIGNIVDKISGTLDNLVDQSQQFYNIHSKSYRELVKQLQEVRKEHQAENFELLQKNRNLQELIDEYEELERLRRIGLFGTEEVERQEALIRELENLDKELIARDGLEINLVETISILETDIAKNAEQVSNNLFEIAKQALDLAEKEFERFIRGEGGGLEDVQNFLIDSITDDLNQDQVAALRNYYKHIIEEAGSLSLDELLSMTTDGRIQNQVSSLTKGINDFNKAIDKNEEGILGLKSSYEDIYETIEEDARPAFEELNRNFVELFDLFENRSPEMQASMERIFNVVGRTPQEINRLATSLDSIGIPLDSFLTSVAHISDELLKTNAALSLDQAASRAIIQVAASLEDAAAAATLYSIAMGRSLLEVSQAADHLTSRIDNLYDVQQKFLSGEVGDQDLFNFIEQYAEYFSDENFFDAFTSGLDLSNFIIREAIELSQEFENQLYAINAQIYAAEQGHVDLEEGQLNYLKGMRNALTLFVEYNGALRNITTTQMHYNNAIKAFELASKMGFDATLAQINLIDALERNMGPSLKRINNDLNTTNDAIQSILNEAGLENVDLNNIYQIIDGVVVLKEGYRELAPVVREAIDSQIEFIELGMEGIYSLFETLMNETLSLEESMAEKRIKVYEDYFDALDRLENRRKKAESRENLVQQLARLEGATDERSRARALEIRQQLNQLDEKSAEEVLQEARTSLIDSINESVKKTRKLFQDIFQEWLSSGTLTAKNLFDKLQEDGLVGDKGWEDIEIKMFAPDQPVEFEMVFDENEINSLIAEIGALFGLLDDPNLSEEERNEIIKEIDILQSQLDKLEEIRLLLGGEPDTNQQDITYDHIKPPEYYQSIEPSPEALAQEEYEQRQAQARAEFDAWRQTVGPIRYWLSAPNKRRQLEEKYNIESFSRGGMVDYTGLAMLHGNRSQPEAVLSAQQTEMFLGLRDALQKLSLDSSSGGSVNIENISISTASLNNNQDFKRAGESLAESFRNAINRKGITINTRKV